MKGRVAKIVLDDNYTVSFYADDDALLSNLKNVSNINVSGSHLVFLSADAASVTLEVYDLVLVSGPSFTQAYAALPRETTKSTEYKARITSVYDFCSKNLIENSYESRFNVDRLIGYCTLYVDDSAAFRLSEGVDDSAATVPIPDEATGAYVRVELTGSEVRIAANGATPDVSTKTGIPITKTGTEIYLGSTSFKNGDVSELSEFRAICAAGDTAALHVTYYRYVNR